MNCDAPHTSDAISLAVQRAVLQTNLTDRGFTMKMRTYLVEDNPTIRDNLISTLEELAPVTTVGTCETEAEGAKWLTTHDGQWDLAIVDLFLRDGTGLGVLQACRNREPLQKLVVFSNYATLEIRSRCAQLGVDAVFDKSTEIDALLDYCLAQSKKLDEVQAQPSATSRGDKPAAARSPGKTTGQITGNVYRFDPNHH